MSAAVAATAPKPRGVERRRSARRSLTEVATDEIARRILSGEYRPGQKLTEQDLARQMNVSRIPVREALRELAREGLVLLIPRHGAFVERMDRTSVAETYDVRSVLESYAAGVCAQHITAAGVAQMEEVIAQMREALAANDLNRYVDLYLRFQGIVWRNARNRVLAELARQLSRRALKFRLIVLRLPGRLEDSLASCEQLLEAMRNKDSRSAEMVRWAALQRAKRAVLAGYLGETVRFERRSELEQDSYNTAAALLPLLTRSHAP